MILSAFVISISDIGLDSDGQSIIQYIHKNRQNELEITGKTVDDTLLEEIQSIKNIRMGSTIFYLVYYPSIRYRQKI